MYGEAVGGGTLATPGLLVRIPSQGIVRHGAEAEPRGKHQANGPGDCDRPEDPVRHAEHQADVLGIAIVAADVADADTPDQGGEPDGHDEEALAAGIAEELLLPGGGLRRWFHRLAPEVGPPSS